MDRIRNGWFSEINNLWPGQCLSLEVDAVLHKEKSDYQEILVIKTKKHGIALILDGIIQCTESDEFSYQEMITFLPLCAHPNPESVLIVGGGDGGVAREVTKHPQVKSCVQVEIDQKVIDVSKRFLPHMAAGFSSPKLTLKVCDGFEYLKHNQKTFDVIITDSSDPIGPATNLFTETYFGLLKGALKSPNGIICSQAGTAWSDLQHVKETVANCGKHFPMVRYALASVPTYPNGQIGFVLGGLNKEKDLREAQYKMTEEQLREMQLKYYSTEMHSAAFVLPNFMRNSLSSIRKTV